MYENISLIIGVLVTCALFILQIIIQLKRDNKKRRLIPKLLAYHFINMVRTLDMYSWGILDVYSLKLPTINIVKLNNIFISPIGFIEFSDNGREIINCSNIGTEGVINDVLGFIKREYNLTMTDFYDWKAKDF